MWVILNFSYWLVIILFYAIMFIYIANRRLLFSSEYD